MTNTTRGVGAFLTLGQIADRLQAPVYRVKYAVEQYRITPIARVGILRVWDENALPRIESALKRIAANRGERL